MTGILVLEYKSHLVGTPKVRAAERDEWLSTVDQHYPDRVQPRASVAEHTGREGGLIKTGALH